MIDVCHNREGLQRRRKGEKEGEAKRVRALADWRQRIPVSTQSGVVRNSIHGVCPHSLFSEKMVSSFHEKGKKGEKTDRKKKGGEQSAQTVPHTHNIPRFVPAERSGGGGAWRKIG